MPNFVTDADGVGCLPRFSSEDLNVVTLDERCHQLEWLMNDMQQQLNFKTESWSKVTGQVDLMGTSIAQQVHRIRGIEDAVGLAPLSFDISIPMSKQLNITLCLAGTLNCRLLVNNLYVGITFGKSATNHRQDKLLQLCATHGTTIMI